MVRRKRVDLQIRDSLQEHEHLSFREIVERRYIIVLKHKLYILREHILNKNTNLTSHL
jgi:hypothetical protein